MNSSMTDTKAKILTAASALFLEGGAKALSVRAIAARANMSTIGIYSHFKGKQGILDALFVEATAMVSDAMDAGNGQPDAKSTMMAAASAYLDFAANHAAHYQLFFGENDPDYEPSEEAQTAARDAYKKLLSHATLLMPEGAKLPDVQETALGFWALLHGFVGLTRHAAAAHTGVQDWRALILRKVEDHIDLFLTRKADQGI